jgi:Ubiquitin-activating enzyme E1 FCCH domain
MTGFHQVLIGGYPGGGLTQDRKPALLANEAFSTLDNAYVFRERTKKRDGEVPIGRLSRVFTSVAIGNSSASPWTFNLYTALSITKETNAQIQPGSVIIVIGTGGGAITFTDQANGTLTSTTGGNSGTINYMTGSVTLTTTAAGGTATTASMTYYPALPVMGILKRDVATFGIDSTVFFDTKYAYQYVNGFQELSVGTTWTGTNTDFFWAANYQGATPNLRYFFVTNNNITLGAATPYDPILYYNNSTWTNLQPIIADNPPSAAQSKLWQALILIPYYGRLLALNTWEGTTAGGVAGATNFFARCRFSQIGDPTDQTNGWRADIFGRGGFLDAPTNESIVSAAFFRNTLIVFFEYSTWQLRYIGEYGVPFIWERISSDFGAICPYSPIVFDQGVMAISDRGVIQAAANGVTRLDEQIPEQAFSFQIQNSAPFFVHGVRDFEKELVYWNYLDTSNASTTQSFPNTVLVFNYRNNTWAKFRDTITCFGIAQFQFGVTWDSLTTFWEDNVSWDNVDDQQYVDYVTLGTQAGFINIYQNPDASTLQPDDVLYAPTMAITAVNFGVNPTQITIPNHNLANNEIIYIQDTIWSGTDPGLNNIIYNVTIVDANTITLSTWNFGSQSYNAVHITSSAVYLGGGIVTLFPKMNIQGKDFNPFQGQGKQFKLSFIDFQMDSNLLSPAIAATTVQLFVNSYLGDQANLVNSNQELLNSSQGCGFITNATQANPCQITSPNHSLVTGNIIYIANVKGMTQLNAALYTITVVDANNFTLNNTNSTGFTAYTTGGIWNTSPMNGQVYIPGSQYAWYRFYSTQFGQYLRIGLTYDDNLMNQLATHQTPMELNAMNIWFREGGRIIN